MLLISKDNLHDLTEKSIWSFLNPDRLKNVGIGAADMKTYSPCLHYLKLTDKNVFGILRKDGNRLEFYSPSEIESLVLTSEAREAYTEHKDEISKIISDNLL